MISKKQQVQDIDALMFEEIKNKKWAKWQWRWFISMLILAMLFLLSVTIFIRRKDRITNSLSLVPTAFPLTPTVAEATPSGIDYFRNEFLKLETEVKGIDPQKEKLQPPSIELNLDL